MDLRWRSIAVWLLLAFTIAAGYDPLITNGTCYYKAGEEMAEEYSPCGNAALSHYWCCQLGDSCHTQYSCFNVESQTTYLAGCTDPDYEDPSCPDKGGYGDQQWTGLVRCFVDNNTLTDEPWATCEDDKQPLVAKSDLANSCVCKGRDPVFTAGTGLPVYATLPASKGDQMTWLAGMEPSTFEFTRGPTTGAASSTSTEILVSPTTRASVTGAATSTSTTATPSSTPSSTATSTSLPTSISSPTPVATTSDFSTGAKVGIGVGAFLGALSIVASAILVGWFLRRRKQKQRSSTSSSVIQRGKKEAFSEPEMHSAAWSGNKPELPNDEYRPELPGDHSRPTSPYTSNANPTGASANSTGPNSPYPSTIVSSPTTSHMQDGRSSMHARDGSHNSQPLSPASTLGGCGQAQQYQPYRPNRYQANSQLGGIAEVPDNERLRWAQMGPGKYGPVDSRSGEHARYVSGEQGSDSMQGAGGQHEVRARNNGPLGRDGLHELPG